MNLYVCRHEPLEYQQLTAANLTYNTFNQQTNHYYTVQDIVQINKCFANQKPSHVTLLCNITSQIGQ